MTSLLSFGDAGWGDELLAGFLVTLRLALTALPIGLIIGLGIALASLSRSKALRRFATAYVTTLRGLPEILSLFAFYYGIGLLLNQMLKAISPEAGFIELSPYLAGAIALALVFGAYAGEVLRGGFQAIPKGQLEAAQAIGMNHVMAFRRITLPQVWRLTLPALSNLWVNLLKDTSLVSIIGLADLMRASDVAARTTKKPFTFFLAACLLYWLTCVLSELIASRMEARANRGARMA